MKLHDKALDTKPLAANNKGVALAVQGKRTLVDAASDGGSYASHGKLILPSLDAYGRPQGSPLLYTGLAW